MNQSRMHLSAAIFLLTAVALYGVSALHGAAGFALLGLFFETIAWIQWFASRRHRKRNEKTQTHS
jgi:hypothetical protein